MEKLHCIWRASLVLGILSAAACAGSSTAMPAGSSTIYAPDLVSRGPFDSISTLSRATKTEPTLYVSLLFSSAVYYFSQKGLYLLGDITNGINQPEGVAVDRKGNLYVTNPYQNDMTVYPPGGSSPSTTYTDNLTGPRDVVVSKKGWVYVANGNPPYHVVSFPPGSTTASKTVVQLSGFGPQGVALDRAGDLYVSYTSTGTSSPQVYKYPPHKTKGHNLGLTVGSPIGIAVDGSGNLLVVDRQSPYESGLPAIEVYPPGAQNPSQVIAYSGFSTPAMLAFNKKRTVLYVADCTRAGDGSVFVFSYPSGNLTNQISFPYGSCPNGVALSPAAP